MLIFLVEEILSQKCQGVEDVNVISEATGVSLLHMVSVQEIKQAISPL